MEGFIKYFDLNLKGLYSDYVLLPDMIKKKSGVIINISSMNSIDLLLIAAYSAAKAAINNFTQWLAVHFSKTGIRVMLLPRISTDQSKQILLMTRKPETYTRGKKIINALQWSATVCLKSLQEHFFTLFQIYRNRYQEYYSSWCDLVHIRS